MDDTSKENDIEQKGGTANQTFYYIQQREGGPWKTVFSQLPELQRDCVVMVQTEHGPEPARIMGVAPVSYDEQSSYRTDWKILDVAGEDDSNAYTELAQSEEDAFRVCSEFVEKHKLQMKLVRVERFFNGSKIIFYFTAENRVDFRALVKDLVQEYRTRIEMRQIGVRHETKMIGGVGICGREFCCASYLDNFSSVSIKMAKEQDLPLNPNKISGVCNRLFCCLTHEYDSYKKERRGLPRPGKHIQIDGEKFLVLRQIVLKRQVVAENSSGDEVLLTTDQLKKAQPVKIKSDKTSKAGSNP